MARFVVVTILGCAAALACAPAASAALGFAGRFDGPSGLSNIAVTGAGDAIFVDVNQGASGSGTMQRYAADGTKGADWSTPFPPFGLAVSAAGGLVVADPANHKVRSFSADGGDLGSFGSDGTGEGRLHGPKDVAIGPGGDIYVLDGGNNRVERFSAGGEYIAQIPNAAAQSPDGYLYPNYLAVDPSSGAVYVTDGGNKTIRKFDATGALVGTFGASGEGQLQSPRGIAVGAAGVLLVADYSGDVVSFMPDGTFVTRFGKDDLDYPIDVAADANGVVYVADGYSNDVVKFAEDKTAPKLTLGGAAKQSVKSGSVKVKVTSDEAASLTAAGAKLSPASGSVAAGKSRTLALKISAAAKRAVRAGKKVVVTVTVKATDASGNVSTAKRKVTLKR